MKRVLIRLEYNRLVVITIEAFDWFADTFRSRFSNKKYERRVDSRVFSRPAFGLAASDLLAAIVGFGTNAAFLQSRSGQVRTI